MEELPLKLKGRDARDGRIIGISGKRGSGKDTAMKIIVQLGLQKFPLMQFIHLNFAKALKELVATCHGQVLDFEHDDFKNELPHSSFPSQDIFLSILKGLVPKILFESFQLEQKHFELWNACKEYYLTSETIGVVLQKIGTEVFRSMVDQDFWVKIWKLNAQTYLDRGYVIIATDVRFIEEVSAIESLQGNVIRIESPSELRLERTDSKRDSDHFSEIALDNHKFQFTLINDGSIQDLFEPLLIITEKIECFDYF